MLFVGYGLSVVASFALFVVVCCLVRDGGFSVCCFLIVCCCLMRVACCVLQLMCGFGDACCLWLVVGCVWFVVCC